MSAQAGPEPFYSLARRAGDLLFLSAFGPVDQNMEVVGETIEEQTRACMQAIPTIAALDILGFEDLFEH